MASFAGAASSRLLRLVASPSLMGPMCQATRGVARVRINRYTGVKAFKIGVPKTEWQISAEKEFLAMRDERPSGYVDRLTEDDVRNLSPEMQGCLSLKCGSAGDISKFRKHEWIRKFQRRPFDFGSPGVKIACLTEKILRLRAHLLRHPKHHQVKRSMGMYLARRHKHMKSLYKSDYVLYKHVCAELGIRKVHYSVPDSRDPSKAINPLAVDGDRAKFLIRQRMYRDRFRPRQLREPDSDRLIRYTRHPMEPVPKSHGKALPTPQQVSRAWPYGVRAERVEGKQVVYNPTAPGRGFWPASSAPFGGPTPQ